MGRAFLVRNLFWWPRVSLLTEAHVMLSETIWPQYRSDNQVRSSFCEVTWRWLMCGGIPQVLIQFDTTNLTSELSDATFAIIPDDYRAEQIAFINSIVADLNE